MAFIRTDPSQTKTVVVLVCILVMATGITVLRLKPAPVTQTASAKQSEQKQDTSTHKPATVVCNLSRNPFERPKDLAQSAVSGISRSIEGLSKGLSVVKQLPNPWQSDGSVKIEPLGVGDISRFNNASTKRSLGNSETDREDSNKQLVPTSDRTIAEPKPTFTLLATVRGPEGFSAVISINGSETRVVEVGDLLEGGFRVKILTEDHALLSNGRENTIAKRPQS